MADDLILLRPSKLLEKEILMYKEEHFAYGDKNIHGTCGLAYYDNFDEWLDLVLSIETDKLRNGVYTSTFFTKRTEDGKLVGCFKMHHFLTEELKSGGHIAYGIRPSERRKGYGKRQLELALNYAKSLWMREVIIACDKHNIASAMTAKCCGGVLSNEFTENGVIKQHYSIDLLEVHACQKHLPYNDTQSERKEAFARLEKLRRKGSVTDYDAELASYREEKYGSQNSG